MVPERGNVPRALPSTAPGDCGRRRRPGLGIFMTIPSSVCSNRFSRWSSRSTSLGLIIPALTP